MNIVIPMAGLGERFRKSGFLLPKPLIPVVNKPMYRYAVDCLPLQLATKVVFILREEDYSEKIAEDIKKNYGNLADYSIVMLKHHTEGQADTIFRSASFLNINAPTLVHNCDTYIQGNFDWLGLANSDNDGAIILFSSRERRWSYAKLDKNRQYVIDLQEKNVISSHASTGTYFFKDTTLFLKLIQSNIEQNLRQNNEFYLSTVYQSMFKLGKKVIPLWTKNILCFGTPQDLVDSLNSLVLARETLQ